MNISSNFTFNSAITFCILQFDQDHLDKIRICVLFIAIILGVMLYISPTGGSTFVFMSPFFQTPSS